MPHDPTSPATHADRQNWRNVSDLLHIWCLCDRARCRRARGCRGDRACVSRYSPLVPEEARTWVCALFYCKEHGLTFDEAAHNLAEAGLQDRYVAWMEAAKRSASRGRAKCAAC